MSTSLLLASLGATVMLLGTAMISQTGKLPDAPLSSPSLAQKGKSSITALELATYLTQSGVKMYGAYWCGHCQHQKEAFGSAFSQINYIECDPKGKNPRPKLCEQARIQGYPTWEIKGKLYPGVQSLQNLAVLSGYRQ
jgi:hypothetical protein